MIVRCLKPFSTGTFAMEQYEIRDVDDTLAAKLISAGLVQEVGGGGLPPVTSADYGQVAVVNGEGDGWTNEGLYENSRRHHVICVIDQQTGDIGTDDEITHDQFNKLISGAGFLQCDFYMNDMYQGSAIMHIAETDNSTFAALDGIYEGEKLRCSLIANGSNNIAPIISWKKYLVTLTPTAADFSGTMDKTVGEINAAYKAGQEIWFKVLTSASTAVEIPLTYWATDSSYEYNGFAANLVNVASNVLIVAYVDRTSDGTWQTYGTKVYPLTPAT